MPKALIVYSTKRGQTGKLAEMVAEELRLLKIDVKVAEVDEINTTRDLFDYNAYIFGSPTYFGEMTDSMKELLFLAEKAELAEKVGGAFGAYGWSGEAPQRIQATMKYIFHMDVTSKPLMISSSTAKIAKEMVHNFCREIAAKIT